MCGVYFILEKDYTYIDYFLIPHCQLHAVLDASIGTIKWSDHAPIVLIYAISDVPPSRNWSWKLNESLLQDPEVLAEVTRELGFYFQSNDTPDCYLGIIWEADKTVIRGVLIKHGSRIKQDRKEKLASLLMEIHNLQFQHKHAPSPTLEWELLTLCRQITDLMLYKAKTALKVCREQYYESDNKCVCWPDPSGNKPWQRIALNF